MAKPFLRASERVAIFHDAGKHEYKNKFQELAHDPKDLPSYQVQDSHDWLMGHPEGAEPHAPAHHAKARYVLLPHWDPEQAVSILHDHHDEMSRERTAARDWSAIPPEERPYHQKFQPGDKVKLEDFMDERQGEQGVVSSVPDRRYKNSLKVNVQWPDGKETQHWWNNVRHASRTPSWAREAAEILGTPTLTPELMTMAKNGGFTLHDHVGDAPTSGYMVSTHKNTEEMRPLSALRPEHIAHYVNAHSRELANPNSYLGGWLDKGNFYLDVSTHRPTLDRAAADAAQNNQLAIYDLGKGQSINTPDAVWAAGDPGLAVRQKPHSPFTGATQPPEDPRRAQQRLLQWLDTLPDHDWTQHTLGDEHYGEHPRRLQAADGPSAPEPVFDPATSEFFKEAPGSSHGAKIFRNPTTKENWLVKPDSTGGMLAHGDVAAHHIAQLSGVETPPTFKSDIGGQPASAQLMYEGAKDAFPGYPLQPDKLSDDDLLAIQKHHALDWLIGNHDGHERQFIRTADGKLVGIDKGQAFKHYNQDRLHWNYHPNSAFSEHEPVYNTLYRSMAQGGRLLNDPRQGELGKYVQGLQDLDDDDYRASLTPYAQAAAQAGFLGKLWKGYDGHDPKKHFTPNDVNSFLDYALTRKHSLVHDMGDIYDRAMAHRTTGTKIAMAAPDPALLKSMHQQMGSHGAKVYQDPQGQWLIKAPPKGAEFMTPLDQATAQLQQRVGLENPETHTIPWKDGSEVSAIKMIPGATQAWQSPPRLSHTDPKDLSTLQKHQALDWLIGNHDGHVGNFMRTAEGNLVGIDKGQAAKYYGRDQLSPTFHPNFYAREPVYNQLWRDYGAGHQGEMDDPREKHSQLGQFIQSLQAIPDEHLKHMFRPYAEAAAHQGMLASIKDDDPRRGLGPATIPPNDPEAFLEAMAKRKNSLATDLGTLYDRQLAHRKQALAQAGDRPITPESEEKHQKSQQHYYEHHQPTWQPKHPHPMADPMAWHQQQEAKGKQLTPSLIDPHWDDED